jgi:hypothetical protein
MVNKVTILCLVRITTPCNDVDSEAAAAQLVERRKLARSERRRDKARSMCQQQPQPLCCCSPMCTNKEAVRCICEVTNQDAIEIRLLVDAGCRRNDIRIERWPLGCQHLRRYSWRDPADHFDRHNGPVSADC